MWTTGVVPRIPLRMLVPRQRTRRHVHLPGVAGAAVTGAAVVGTVVVVVAVAAADVAAATPTDVAPAFVYVVAAAIAAGSVAVAVAIVAGSVAVAVVGSVAIVDGCVGLSGENHLLH